MREIQLNVKKKGIKRDTLGQASTETKFVRKM